MEDLLSRVVPTEPKQKEVVKLHVTLIQDLLKPLEPEDRNAILTELAIVEAVENHNLARQLDEARANTEEWRRHNEQRLESVYAARELLEARPDESLVDAIRRRGF